MESLLSSTQKEARASEPGKARQAATLIDENALGHFAPPYDGPGPDYGEGRKARPVKEDPRPRDQRF